MGHLSIAGSKMSKSLKNFQTIRDALARGDWNARSLRIIFLLGGWHDGIEITEDMKKNGAGWQSYVTNLFLKAKDLEVHPTITSGSEDAKVQEALKVCEEKVGYVHDFNPGISPKCSQSIQERARRLVRHPGSNARHLKSHHRLQLRGQVWPV
jgi:cysteinyl-tRNA synthetase